MTRPSELRDMDDRELLERLEASKEELFNLRFQMATGQLDDPMLIKATRHDIARILTVLRERELEALEAGEMDVEAEDQEEAS
jgi:large subunit ribosomal protein L29